MFILWPILAKELLHVKCVAFRAVTNHKVQEGDIPGCLCDRGCSYKA